MNRITVFCGSSSGTEDIFNETAYALGAFLAERQIEVVYGGAKVGLMGKVAQGALDNGGRVVGVLPHFLSTKEIAHDGLTEMIIVNTMHERKMIMHEMCDGFIALPGGFGTFEELFEVLTWAQLGLHKKPIGLLNLNGFYDDLNEMVQKMVDKGFLNELNQNMLLKGNTIEDLFLKLRTYDAPEVPKWINRETT